MTGPKSAEARAQAMAQTAARAMGALNPGNSPVAPKLAAAAIVYSDDPEGRVLLIRRSDTMRFMAGHHAFPGGRVDATEGCACVCNCANPDEAVALHAVVREVFEETGLLLSRGPLPPREERRTLRRALLSDQITFDEILEQIHHSIDASDFTDAGTWITPPSVPIRFHTHYFMTRAHRTAEVELDELNRGEIAGIDWLTPAEARELWRVGELLLPAPVAYVLQQLAEAGPQGALEPLRRTTHLEGDRPGRIEYRCGIHSVPVKAPALPPADMTNCVIVGDREIYVIDPGTTEPAERDILARQLTELTAYGGRVAAVLLTHSHLDHVASAEFIRETFGAPIWAHAAAAPQVSFPIDRFLEDNEILPVAGRPDWRLRALHTPGHDPGHLCFLEETTRTMICGDMVANGSTIIVSQKYGGDMDAYLRSLERLLAEDYDLMIPGHGMVFFEDPKRIVRHYIEHRLAREARIKAAFEAGHTTLEALLRTAYADTPPKLWPLAEHSLRAHLKRLGVELPESPLLDVSGGI
jgi:endoribonuclease LACTB2